MPVISIVLPSYNGEKYIAQSIDSILSQTFKDWELIIVNDCSADCTLEIAEEYAKKDSRIRVINNEKNQRLPNSLNIGFAEAKGEYLTWTSDDNAYLPDALQEMYHKLSSEDDLYMVCADMDVIDENNIVTGKAVPYDSEFIYYGDTVGACFLYKREVYEKIGNYDDTMVLVEDYDYWIRVLQNFEKIERIPKVLYLYRMHTMSLTGTRLTEIKRQLANMRKHYFEFLIQHLQNNQMLLSRMYYDFLETNYEDSFIYKRLKELVPVLRMDQKIELDEKEIIVYGTGQIGEMATKYIGNKVAFFVDRDERKVGTCKYGVKIYPIEEIFKNPSRYNLVLAIGNEKIYEVLQLLKENGITNCCTYRNLVANEKKMIC